VSDASAEPQDFKIITLCLLENLRVAVESRSQNSLDPFPSYRNYLIQNEEVARALFSIDRIPVRIVMNSTLVGPL
jgi:hypothetical protein